MSGGDENKSCPFCCELIKASAIKCKHCKSALIPLSENISGNGQIHINNTVSSKPNVKPKPNFYNVNPMPYTEDKKIVHGVTSIGLSVLMLLGSASILEDPYLTPNEINDMVAGIEIIFMFIIGYALWIMSQAYSNKVLPVICLALSIFGAIATIGYVT